MFCVFYFQTVARTKLHSAFVLAFSTSFWMSSQNSPYSVLGSSVYLGLSFLYFERDLRTRTSTIEPEGDAYGEMGRCNP